MNDQIMLWRIINLLVTVKCMGMWGAIMKIIYFTHVKNILKIYFNEWGNALVAYNIVYAIAITLRNTACRKITWNGKQYSECKKYSYPNN